MQIAVALLFDAVVFLLIAGAVASAWRWPFATGLFPLTIGIPVLGVALGQLVKDIVRSLKGPSAGGERSSERIRDIEVDRTVPVDLVVKRAGSFYLTALGFFALILLVGFPLAVPIFTAGYLRFLSRASWLLTAILTALMVALVLGAFDHLLSIPWPESVLDRMLAN